MDMIQTYLMYYTYLDRYESFYFICVSFMSTGRLWVLRMSDNIPPSEADHYTISTFFGAQWTT